MSFEPQNWPLVKLSDLITVKHGFAFKGEFFSDEPTELQLTTPGNFAIGGGFQLGKGKFYSGEYPTEYVLKNGDLIVTMTDLSKAADTLGYAAIVPKTEGTIWLHNQRVGLVQIKKDAPVKLDFLHYLMRTADYRHWVVSTATGSTVKHTSPSRICDYEFRLPPLWLQSEIGRILTAHDARITLLRETNATLEAIAQALFKSWFVDFDPVHANAAALENKEQAPSLPPEIQALFPATFTDSPQGPIPEGWNVVPFTETINVIGGGTPKTSIAEYWGGDIPWFSVVDAPAESDVFVIDTEKHITELGLNNSSTKLLASGTTIISARGTVGRLALVGRDMAMNQSCYGLRGKYGDDYFTFFTTYRLVEALKQRSHGSVFDTITRDTLAGVSVVYPDKTVVSAFEDSVGSVMEKIKNNLLQAQTLAITRDTLLPRLISGQLRLPEAEQAIAAITD